MLSPDSPELADLAARWRSAYVHIPFCQRRCPYCDFAVIAPGDPNTENLDDLTARYMSALHSEIDMEPPWEGLDAINLGGGTPSAVGALALKEVIDHLSANFGVNPGAEVSVEVNPEDVSEELLAGLASAGVTRVSIGVQSFDEAILESLGRAHTATTAVSAVAMCSPLFSTSIDLILGTPAESLDSWAVTVDTALGLYPHHLSAYALTVEKGTELWRQVRRGGDAPDSDDQADKYELLQKAVGDAGLVQYEVSNFARPGHTCRYNLSTWGQGEYLAFGLGAHGHRDGRRRRNVRSVNAYLERVEAGRRPEAASEPIGDTEMERLVLGLRRSCGVDLGEFEGEAERHSALQRLASAGVIELKRGRLRVLRPLLTDEVGATVLSLSP